MFANYLMDGDDPELKTLVVLLEKQNPCVYVFFNTNFQCMCIIKIIFFNSPFCFFLKPLELEVRSLKLHLITYIIWFPNVLKHRPHF